MDNDTTTMSFDEWTAEYGEIPTLEALKAKYPQYAAQPTEDEWERLDEQNQESLERWLASGRQS